MIAALQYLGARSKCAGMVSLLGLHPMKIVQVHRLIVLINMEGSVATVAFLMNEHQEIRHFTALIWKRNMQALWMK